MLYKPNTPSVNGKPVQYWCIGSDLKPDFRMRHNLKRDLCERRVGHKYATIPVLILAVNAGIQMGFFGANGWALLFIALMFVVAVVGFTLSGRKSVELRDRVRLNAYLSTNSARVADLSGSVGGILVNRFAIRNIAFNSLTAPESRLIDEYFAGINTAELDEILSAEGADENKQCVILRAELVSRADRVCEAVKSLREEMAAADSRFKQIVQDDLGDRAAGAQAQLSNAAGKALAAIRS